MMVWALKQRDGGAFSCWCVCDLLYECVETYAVTEGDPRCQSFITSGSFARPDYAGCQLHRPTVSAGHR